MQEPLNYCLYARKSSESDERQAMSIDSQIKEMLASAEKEGLYIKEIRQESHSAKLSGARPVFSRLIEDIRSSKFDGILTWAPDRLSRNAGDLGMIVDLMDNGKLQSIKTYGQSFSNTPNDKFLLMILCSQAKLENDNKGVNVKRGIRTKCEMGWRPSVAPLGYMNRAFGGVKDIIIDPERAPLIKELFEKVAYYYYSGRQIKVWLDDKGFTTRKLKRISVSMVYLMLRNPFYYGYFEFPVGSGKWYKGSHEPIITKETFDEVQKELDDGHPPKVWGKKEFPYKGLFSCYACGTSVCGEEKYRKRKDGTSKHHIYYHCTRSRNPKCKEPCIKEKDLVKQIRDHIKHLTEEMIAKNIPVDLKNRLKQYEPIVKEINFYSQSIYEEEDELVSLKQLVLYASVKAPIDIKRHLVALLPLPKKLLNASLTN